MRHGLTTQHEFHLVVNPAGDEGISAGNTDLTCRNTAQSQTARMTPGVAVTGKASTSKNTV